MQLIAIDPSITCSGWALFEVASEELLGVGKIKPPPASVPFTERLAKLNQEINQLFKTLGLDSDDCLIAEAPTTMRDPSAAIKVEQVRCSFETIARQYALQVPGRINPRSVHYEVLGLKGKQIIRKEIKEMACNTVSKLYQNALENMIRSELKNIKKQKRLL